MLQREGLVPGLRVVAEFASSAEEDVIMSLVDDVLAGSGGGAVVTALKRRVTVHYGYEFDYKLRSVNPNAPLHNMPVVVQDLCQRLYRCGVLAVRVFHAMRGICSDAIFQCCIFEQLLLNHDFSQHFLLSITRHFLHLRLSLPISSHLFPSPPISPCTSVRELRLGWQTNAQSTSTSQAKE
jgi:hypothetical protein